MNPTNQSTERNNRVTRELGYCVPSPPPITSNEGHSGSAFDAVHIKHLIKLTDTFQFEPTTEEAPYHIGHLYLKNPGEFQLPVSLYNRPVEPWLGLREKNTVARRPVVVAMVILSGTAGPISINCGQVEAKPADLMPVETGRVAVEACTVAEQEVCLL